MKRSKFSLSNYQLITADMGKLIPVQCIETLPGDTFQMSTSALIRMAAMLAPVMHPVHVRFHHWFVPTRLLWDEWEDFITGGPDGMDASVIPRVAYLDHGKGTLWDYFGFPVHLPSDDINGVEISALPFRAYNLIYNEFYRDQDLVAEVDLSNTDTLNVSWFKDYFTTSRPWTQKGPEITLPLAGTAPVTGTAPAVGSGNTVMLDSDVGQGPMQYSTASLAIGGQVPTDWTDATFVDPGIDVVADGHFNADLSTVNAPSVNDFREAFALQRYAEARARYGSRYAEYLRYLGVTPADARLQRPEYIGGGKQTLAFSEVIQTAADTINNSPVGTLRGHGISALRTRRARKFFSEHGYVMTLMSVIPKNIYTDGINRMFLRKDKEDYYQRELQHIGQQEILNNEVYASLDNGNATFGFGDRYSEYRSHPSGVHGDFRDTLSHWHLGRMFESPPVLNQSFIECNPSKRIFADQNSQPLWCMVQNKVAARRPMSKRTGIGSIR